MSEPSANTNPTIAMHEDGASPGTGIPEPVVEENIEDCFLSPEAVEAEPEPEDTAGSETQGAPADADAPREAHQAANVDADQALDEAQEAAEAVARDADAESDAGADALEAAVDLAASSAPAEPTQPAASEPQDDDHPGEDVAIGAHHGDAAAAPSTQPNPEVAQTIDQLDRALAEEASGLTEDDLESLEQIESVEAPDSAGDPADPEAPPLSEVDDPVQAQPDDDHSTEHAAADTEAPDRSENSSASDDEDGLAADTAEDGVDTEAETVDPADAEAIPPRRHRPKIVRAVMAVLGLLSAPIRLVPDPMRHYVDWLALSLAFWSPIVWLAAWLILQ